MQGNGGDSTCRSSPDGAGRDIIVAGFNLETWASRLASSLDRLSTPDWYGCSSARLSPMAETPSPLQSVMPVPVDNPYLLYHGRRGRDRRW